MKKLILVLLAFGVIIFVGCSSDAVSKESTKENPFSKKEGTSTNNPISKKDKVLSSSVAAIVNDIEISLSDFQRRLHKKLFVMKAKGQPVPGNNKKEQQKYLQDSVITELVKEKLLLSIAKEQNILPTDQELQEVLNQIKGNFPSEEIFRQTMESRGINEENIINFNRVQIINERLAAKLGGIEKATQYVLDLEKNAQIKVNETIITPLIQHEL